MVILLKVLGEDQKMRHLVRKISDNEYEYRGFKIKEFTDETVKNFFIEIPNGIFSTHASTLKEVTVDIDEIANKYSTEPLEEMVKKETIEFAKSDLEIGMVVEFRNQGTHEITEEDYVRDERGINFFDIFDNMLYSLREKELDIMLVTTNEQECYDMIWERTEYLPITR